MIRLILIASAALAATPALAASPFDGTWKTDMKTAHFPTKPDMAEIKGGMYMCSTCTPAVKTPADGKPHAVPGHASYDMLTVTVKDPRTVEYSYGKSGKTVGMRTETVSADGKTLTGKGRYTNIATGKTAESSFTSTRVGPAAPGAHATSGSWITKGVEANASATTMMLKASGGMLHVAFATGESFDAKVGGPYVLNKNDPAKLMSKITMPSPRSFEETDMAVGKVASITRCTLEAGDKALACTSKDPRNGMVSSYKMLKQ